jgi:hypothetical protein
MSREDFGVILSSGNCTCWLPSLTGGHSEVISVSVAITPCLPSASERAVVELILANECSGAFELRARIDCVGRRKWGVDSVSVDLRVHGSATCRNWQGPPPRAGKTLPDQVRNRLRFAFSVGSLRSRIW